MSSVSSVSSGGRVGVFRAVILSSSHQGNLDGTFKPSRRHACRSTVRPTCHHLADAGVRSKPPRPPVPSISCACAALRHGPPRPMRCLIRRFGREPDCVVIFRSRPRPGHVPPRCGLTSAVCTTGLPSCSRFRAGASLPSRSRPIVFTCLPLKTFAEQPG